VIQTLTDSITYWFKETIDSISRSTPASPPVHAAYTQCGFYVVESKPTPPTIRRALSQYMVGDAFLKKLRSTTVLPRISLGFEHERRWQSTKWPFGIEVPIVLETTTTNEGPHVPGHPIPPPLAVLHAPTVMPAFSAADRAETWHATIGAALGFAQFLLDYKVTWSDGKPETPTAAIEFGEQIRTFSQAEFTLLLQPVGGWKTLYRMPDLLPLSSAGKFQYIATGTQAGKPSAEILNIQAAFEWKQVPVAFTDDRVVTQPWASSPM
jgi:hypothetical protein